MSNLHTIATAGEQCLHEAILTALEQDPGDGMSARKIADRLKLSGPGCESMVESHLKHRLKQAGKVYTTRGPKVTWILTDAERTRRRG